MAQTKRRVRVTVQIEIRKSVQAISVFNDAAVASANAVSASSILSSPPGLTEIGYGEVFTILAGYARRVAGSLTIHGTLDCAGELDII